MKPLFYIISFIFSYIFGVCIGYIAFGGNFRKPTAMNVYQGKTTLEITYRDGVPVDNVVVFKDKEK